jgi:hypothetical protein
LIAGIAGLLLYTIFVGFGLLNGNVPAERAYLLMALPCIVPAIWYLVGFLRAEGGDVGLVVSSLGWFLLALSLFSRHLATQADLTRGMRLDQAGDSPASWIFALLGFLALVSGGMLSSRYLLDKST